jgi:hypothetical protein
VRCPPSETTHGQTDGRAFLPWCRSRYRRRVILKLGAGHPKEVTHRLLLGAIKRPSMFSIAILLTLLAAFVAMVAAIADAEGP